MDDRKYKHAVQIVINPTDTEGDQVTPTSPVLIRQQGEVLTMSARQLVDTMNQWLADVQTQTNDVTTWRDYLKHHHLALQFRGYDVVGSVVTVPAHVRELRYLHVPPALYNIPDLALVCKWDGPSGRLMESSLYCCHFLPETLNSTAYVCPWPYANVHDNGRICWGSTDTRTLTVTNPIGPVELFFGSAFNNDLWRGGMRPQGQPGSTVLTFTPPPYADRFDTMIRTILRTHNG